MPSLPIRTIMLAALPLLLLFTACRKDPNGYTDVSGWVIDQVTKDSLPNVTVNLLQCDENNGGCFVRKSTKTDASGFFRITFQGRDKRQFKVEVQANDSISTSDPILIRAGFPVASRPLMVQRGIYETVHLVIHKNDAPFLQIGQRQIRNGVLDSVFQIGGFPMRKDTVRISVLDAAGQFWRGRDVPLPFDPANREPVRVEIADMLLEPRIP